MKSILSFFVALAATFCLSSCGSQVSIDHIYKITTSGHISNTEALTYLTSSVDTKSYFIATEKSNTDRADKEAKAWFSSQLSNVDEATLLSYLNSGDYCQLILQRLNPTPEGQSTLNIESSEIWSK